MFSQLLLYPSPMWPCVAKLCPVRPKLSQLRQSWAQLAHVFRHLPCTILRQFRSSQGSLGDPSCPPLPTYGPPAEHRTGRTSMRTTSPRPSSTPPLRSRSTAAPCRPSSVGTPNSSTARTSQSSGPTARNCGPNSPRPAKRSRRRAGDLAASDSHAGDSAASDSHAGDLAAMTCGRLGSQVMRATSQP